MHEDKAQGVFNRVGGLIGLQKSSFHSQESLVTLEKEFQGASCFL